MPREQIITGIDIGSRYVYTVAASFNPDISLPQVVAVGRARSAGIRKGVITDADDAAEAIRKSIKDAEQSAGIQISSAFVTVGGDHIVSMPSRGVVAVSRADQEISEEDVERVHAAACTIAMPKNREILHNIPKEYIVDSEGGLSDVVGMSGMRLEANTLLVAGSTAHMKSAAKCVQDSGVEVEGTVLAPLAAAKSVLSKRQKELGVLCLDIGAGTTNISVFEEGNLIYANVLPVGGDNITNDLAIGLRINIDVAERLKHEYGMALASEVSKRDVIELSQLDPNETETVSRKDVVEIMEARLFEIFDMVNKELGAIDKEAFLPGGVVLVGGTAKTPHIVDLCKMKLRLPTQIGFPKDVEGINFSVDDPSFASVMGLVFWGFEEGDGASGAGKVSMPGISWMGGPMAKIKKWLKALLP